MKRLISLSLALTLLGSSLAAAQPAPSRDEHKPQQQQQQQQNREPQQAPQQQGRPDEHRGGPGPQAFGPGGPHWSRGDRIRGHDYPVVDYRKHHLKKPRRGYHWVQDERGNFLEVAIATGLIAAIIAASSH